jgi:tRNA(fMet)-specific endonuclease VapC
MEVFNDFLNGVKLLSLSPTIMQEFAYLRGLLRSQGMLIGDLDLLIAATALHHNLILLTNNRNHFLRIPGLRVVSVE